MRILLLLAGLLSLAAQAGEWRLVWSDEFNSPGLPDTNNWNYEKGFVRNHESQLYTRLRPENARVENGKLVIECRKEMPRPGETNAVEYTSASLVSRTNWLYGRFEMRAIIPSGKGIWPAFWTKGADSVPWPACGEIDIMEFVGKDPNHIHANVHFSGNGRHSSAAGQLNVYRPFALSHTYAMEWYPDHIDFFFDNHKYHSFNTNLAGTGANNPFRKPHNLILNLALGGNWGGPFDDAILPQQYVIDYVRVYQQN